MLYCVYSKTSCPILMYICFLPRLYYSDIAVIHSLVQNILFCVFLSVYLWDMFLEVGLLGHRTNARIFLDIIKFLSKVDLTFCISITNIGECFIHLYPQRILPNFWILANSICENWDLREVLICSFLLWAKQNIFLYF